MEEARTLNCHVYEDQWNRIVVFSEYCKSCELCITECPEECLYWSDEILGVYGTPVPECKIELCIGCKLCEVICPDVAIAYERIARKPKEAKEKAKAAVTA